MKPTVILDGKELQGLPEGMETVADYLGYIARDLDEEYRVSSVTLNGQDITGQVDGHLKPTDAGMTLDVKTSNANRMSLETLESIEGFHGDLLKELQRTAEEFRLGGYERANELFVRCLDGLQILLNTTFSVANLLQIKISEVEAGEQDSMEHAAKRMNEVFEEMLEAQMNQDGILIADLIEYELHPLLEDWMGAISELKEAGKAA